MIVKPRHFLVLFVGILILFFTARTNYLLIHSLIEIFAIVIAAQISIIGIKTYRYSQNNLILFLGIAYLFVALFDFFHVLTFRGMGVFPQFAGANKATQFWVTGRMIEVLSLMLAPSFAQQKLNWIQTAGVFAATALTLLFILLSTNLFPTCFIDGAGLTSFKISCEYLICLVLIISAMRFRKKKLFIDRAFYSFLMISIIFSVLSELSFTVYTDVYGIMNFVGHIFKLVSYVLVFKGIIDLGIKYPFDSILSQLNNSLQEIEKKNAELHREIEIRIEHEQTSKQAYGELDQIFEAAADGMCVVDKDYNLVRINNSFCTLLGRPKEKVLGKKCFQVFHGPLCHSTKCGLERIFSGNSRYEYTVEHEWQDGHVIFGIVTVSPFYDSKGTVIGIVENFKDLTHLRRMEEEIQRMEKLNMIGDIAVGLGHEIRNPLTTVRGFTQLLKDNYPQIPNIYYLETMLDELDRANMVISEFLFLSRDKAVNKIRQNINDIVLDIEAIITAEAKISGHSLKLEIEPVPEVLLDLGEVRQLLMHLTRNGLEAMPEPGTLTIATYQENGNTVLAVSDQGLGIPNEVLKKIGTPFQSTKDFSLGLGLPVCYAIAQRHNAIINIETKTSGTKISVAFPSAGHV